jgi:hypothetical protein
MKRLFIICILVGILFYSCREQINFDKVPYLEFVSLTKIDNGTSIDEKATLILYFTDGDGDIGLDETFDYPPYDSASDYHNNFFVTYYAKRNGEFVAFPEFEFNVRLPRFLSSDNPEPLEGEIERILDIRNINPVSPDVDTIKFKCWIVDRDLNESEPIFTNELIVRNR